MQVLKSKADLKRAPREFLGVSTPAKYSSLKANVAANVAGQVWRALLGFAFIPLYIRYLGVEAYGLIGVFAVLQAWLSLLDLGLRPTLNREMARFLGGENDADGVRDLLRSVEIICLLAAAVFFLAVWAASGWLAGNWLAAQSLSPQAVSQAITIMGAVAALAFMDTIYISSIAGLQRQVAQNIAMSAIVTVRYFGVIGILAWVSPTIQAYFLWQAFTSILSVCVLASLVYWTLPSSGRRARFSVPALRRIWRFAGGTAGITLLGMMLTQMDKTLLSKLLPLEEFAHYALASTVTSALYMFVAPITAAIYPHMTQLVAGGNGEALRRSYHEGAQLATVLVGPAALMLILFGDRILLLWTGDPNLTAKVAPLLRVLACGTLLSNLMGMPHYLQMAHGWTSLLIRINIVALAVLIPAILLAVRAYGAIGAAWVWVALNTGYIVVVIALMHRRLLPLEKWRWYRSDVGIPLACAISAACILRWATPLNLGPIAEVLALGLTFGLLLCTAMLSAPNVRSRLLATMAMLSRHVVG
ncbi:MAG: lipopolysaccharide biosynthesis protein [Rhodomicrobium sp.]